MVGLYLKAYYNLIKRDLGILKIIFTIFDVLLLFGYPIFAICMKIGNLYVNIAALILNFICIAFEYIFDYRMRNIVQKFHRWGLVIITGVSLGLTIYSIYLAASNINGINIIFTTLLIISWFLRVAFAILYEIFVPRAELLGEVLKEEIKPGLKAYNMTIARLPDWDECTLAQQETSQKIYNLFKKNNKLKDQEIYSDIKTYIKNNKTQIAKSCEENDENDILTDIFSIKGLIIDKTDYIAPLFLEELGRKKAKKLSKKCPTKLDLTLEDCNEKVEKVIKENSKFIKNLKKYYSKNSKKIGSYNYHDCKWIEALSLAMVPIQKILYIYGYDQFDEGKHITDFQKQGIELTLNVVCDCENAKESKKTLFEIIQNELVNKAKSFAGEKFDKVKEKPKLVAKQARKLIPFISSALKNSDPQIALLLDLIAKSSDQNKDNEDDEDNEQEN